MTTTTTFGHLDITYDERVLQPRAWTTLQSTWAAELIAEGPEGPVLELCAGVGQIGLLTVAIEPRDIVLVDLNPVACEYARTNAAATSLTTRVDVRPGRLTQVLEPGERFALIIADPPWVSSHDTGRFPEDPLIAIDGGADGLDVAWECVAVIADHLDERGAAVLQLGTEGQVDALRAHLDARPALRLTVVATRGHEDRGVLVHLRRPAQAGTVT